MTHNRDRCVVPALDSMTGYPAPLSGYLTVMWHPGAQRMLPVLVQSSFQAQAFVRR